MDIQEGTTRKTSPNDANRVVWAVGAFFTNVQIFSKEEWKNDV